MADSGFALAHYRLGSSLLHTPVDFETKNQSGDRAVRFGAVLPRSEQLLFEGFRAMLRGDAERAERTLRDLLFEFPDHVEGWFTLGWNYYLYNYLHDKTAIIITHRIFSSFPFDQILVMDHGELAEQGTHEQLMAQNGYYAELFRMQLRAEKEPETGV